MPPRRSRHQPLQNEQQQPQTDHQQDSAVPQSDNQDQQQAQVTENGNAKAKGKGKGKANQDEVDADADHHHQPQAEATSTSTSTTPAPVTMQDRMEKMKQLKQKMAASSKSNRSALLTEQSKHRQSAKAIAAQERKMARAEAELDLRDMKERGEDVERNRNWNYSVQDSENWEEKLEKKEERRDPGAVDFTSAAARSYARQISQLKPDHSAYNSQKDSSSSTGSGGSSSSQALIRNDERGLQTNLSKGYDSLNYGNHKPDEKALDRVIGHLNSEAEMRAKRSRKRPEDPDAEVTYINDKNKHFNKKVNRHFDQYTKEIRENFERGTAL